MSIWQAVKGAKRLQRIDVKAERMVECQSYIATRSLVDSVQEQKILEEEIEKSKPPFPHKNSRGKLHWLLFTPFRYPPLQEGGRFHRRTEQSIFYGALELKTVMAEIAYKRFVFRASSKAKMQPMSVDYTKFTVEIRSEKGIDLTAAPFDKYRMTISDPTSHAESQILGTHMREAGVEAFLFYSARIAKGVNCGIMSVEAFGSNQPSDMRDWVVYDSENVVEFSRHIPTQQSKAHIFRRDDFLINSKLPLFS